MIIKKKSLGQNFLNSKKALEDIVSAGKIDKNDIVLEIGPGEGALTEKLLLTGVKIICVEKDDRLIPILQDKFKKELISKQLVLIHDDILNLDISQIVGKKYKLIANIPYYITGLIFRKFLETDHQPLSITLLVQKEVAERVVAKDKKESLLSLSVKAFGDPVFIRVVPRGAFTPKPNVDSAILNIENISNNKLGELEKDELFRILHAGFAHKRKQLLPNLSAIKNRDALIKAFSNLKLDQKVRAEDLDIYKWVSLCKAILNS